MGGRRQLVNTAETADWFKVATDDPGSLSKPVFQLFAMQCIGFHE